MFYIFTFSLFDTCLHLNFFWSSVLLLTTFSINLYSNCFLVSSGSLVVMFGVFLISKLEMRISGTNICSYVRAPPPCRFWSLHLSGNTSSCKDKTNFTCQGHLLANWIQNLRSCRFSHQSVFCINRLQLRWNYQVDKIKNRGKRRVQQYLKIISNVFHYCPSPLLGAYTMSRCDLLQKASFYYELTFHSSLRGGPKIPALLPSLSYYSFSLAYSFHALHQVVFCLLSYNIGLGQFLSFTWSS